MNSKELYNQYKTKLQKIADVKYATAVLQWDQETYLPPKGNTIRGQQIATLSEMAHRQFTEESTGALLNELIAKNDLDNKEKKNVQLSLEDYTKSKKLSSAFVRLLSETVTKSFHAWIQARKDNSFSVFQQPLDDLIQLKKQEADLLGYQQHPYNALMNDYDKGLTVEIVDRVFADLKPQLSALLDKIKNKAESNLIFSETSALNKSMSLAYYEYLGDIDLINTEVDIYNTITSEEIMKVSKSMFQKDRCAELVYLPI